MSENVRFYKCPVCGNIIGLIDGNIENIKCCGRTMEQMVANSTDAATEKHVPVCEKVGDEVIVKVGEVEHPMVEEHYIMWIAQVSENRTTRVTLKPNEKPEAKFPYIPGSTIFAYCDKHGLWKTTI